MEAKATFSPQVQQESSQELLQMRASIQQSNQMRSADADRRADDVSSIAEDKQILDSFSPQEAPNENA
jgi:hypothetical protein